MFFLVRQTSLRNNSLRLRFEALLHFLDELIDAEARRSLTRRKFLKRGQKRAHDRGSGDERSGTVRYEPVVVGVRRDIRPLVGVRPQIEEFRDTQLGKGL